MSTLAQAPQSAGVPLGPTFGSPWGTTPGYHLGTLTTQILTAAMSLAGVITLFLFIFGGLKIIASAGSGDSRSAAEGKQVVTWAVIGFIIIFTAYWIIRVIELTTGIDFITDPGSIFGYPSQEEPL